MYVQKALGRMGIYDTVHTSSYNCCYSTKSGWCSIYPRENALKTQMILGLKLRRFRQEQDIEKGGMDLDINDQQHGLGEVSYAVSARFRRRHCCDAEDLDGR